MSRTAKTQENSLSLMLESIRQNHIDIIPIIQEELENILPQVIEETISNVYFSLDAMLNLECIRGHGEQNRNFLTFSEKNGRIYVTIEIGLL